MQRTFVHEQLRTIFVVRLFCLFEYSSCIWLQPDSSVYWQRIFPKPIIGPFDKHVDVTAKLAVKNVCVTFLRFHMVQILLGNSTRLNFWKTVYWNISRKCFLILIHVVFFELMLFSNCRFDLVHEDLSPKLYPCRGEFNRKFVFYWSLQWNLGSPKTPKSSINIDTFRHSTCLAVTTGSIFPIKVPFENFTLVEED